MRAMDLGEVGVDLGEAGVATMVVGVAGVGVVGAVISGGETIIVY